MITLAKESFKSDETLYLNQYIHPILGECIGYAHPYPTTEKYIKRRLNGNKLHPYEADLLVEIDVYNLLSLFQKYVPYILTDVDDVRKVALLNIAHLVTPSRFFVYFKKSFYTLADQLYTRAAVQMENSPWSKENIHNYRLRKNLHLIEFGVIQPWFQ
jgi:hypothetical protein